METRQRTLLVTGSCWHIVGNEMLDDEVTTSTGRY
jgi:hypothetical protein